MRGGIRFSWKGWYYNLWRRLNRLEIKGCSTLFKTQKESEGKNPPDSFLSNVSDPNLEIAILFKIVQDHITMPLGLTQPQSPMCKGCKLYFGDR